MTLQRFVVGLLAAGLLVGTAACKSQNQGTGGTGGSGQEPPQQGQEQQQGQQGMAPGESESGIGGSAQGAPDGGAKK